MRKLKFFFRTSKNEKGEGNEAKRREISGSETTLGRSQGATIQT